MTTLKTLRDAEQYAAEQGIVLSPNERKRIGEIQNAERERLAALQVHTAPDMAARFNELYPRLLKFILSVGETLLTFSQTILVSFGVPLVLVLLLIVEHQRVVHGIALFEVDYNLASFAAAALVLLNLVLEFQIHHIEHAAGYLEAQGRVWSLRIWAHNALYTLGIGEAWQEQLLSPAARQKKTLRLVTFSILALALVGSMKTVMDKQTGAWNEALIDIATKSTLTEIMTWAGGLLFALTAVLGAQVLSRYVAIRCVEIIAQMNAQQTSAIDPLQADIEAAGANAALAIIREKQAIKAAKASKSAAQTHDTMPIDSPVMAHEAAKEVMVSADFLSPIPQSTNGHGH